METEGLLAPASETAVREQYEAVAPAAEVTAKEVAKTLELEATAPHEQVDEDVILTAHEAIFASLLSVHVGTREEFAVWLADIDRDPEVTELGSEHVTGVAWHHAPVENRVLAATFADEPEAAAHALRRQAFATCYSEVV